jgi:curli production assembly/transport component CsgF
MKRGGAARLSWAGIQALMLLGVPMLAHASQLLYTPVNPNFGGSPLNGGFLQYEATANNHFLTNPASVNPNSAASAQSQVIQNLQQAAVNAVLSMVAQQISTGLQNNTSGSYNIAGELISFQRVGSVINIQMTDATTGAQTTIQIPVPTF